MRSFISTCSLYLFMAGFIVAWWMLAFHTNSSQFSTGPGVSQSLFLKTATLLDELSPLQREGLHQALAGQVPLMLQFIDQWEQDAQFLAQKNIPGIQHLSPENYLQAHILGRLLNDSSPEILRQLNCRMNLDQMQDDSGQIVPIKDSFKRFLPQTYVAASFLLAIAKPEEIIALPKGIRRLPQLYKTDIVSRIPTNIDRIYSEGLFLACPDLAFVAPYSHPPALEVLRNQAIPLFTLNYINTPEDIIEALLKVGHASNHPLEAQLLAIFMEASFLAIDNRLHALQEGANGPLASRKMLFLYYHQYFMVPTLKSLTGQLMARALGHCPHLACPIPQNQDMWRIPYEQEKILHANPDCLIISMPYHYTPEYASGQRQILPLLEGFDPQRIVYVDESIQESPTQYIVLAYFDLFQAISSLLTQAASHEYSI